MFVSYLCFFWKTLKRNRCSWNTIPLSIFSSSPEVVIFSKLVCRCTYIYNRDYYFLCVKLLCNDVYSYTKGQLNCFCFFHCFQQCCHEYPSCAKYGTDHVEVVLLRGGHLPFQLFPDCSQRNYGRIRSWAQFLWVPLSQHLC